VPKDEEPLLGALSDPLTSGVLDNVALDELSAPKWSGAGGYDVLSRRTIVRLLAIGAVIACILVGLLHWASSRRMANLKVPASAPVTPERTPRKSITPVEPKPRPNPGARPAEETEVRGAGGTLPKGPSASAAPDKAPENTPDAPPRSAAPPKESTATISPGDETRNGAEPSALDMLVTRRLPAKKEADVRIPDETKQGVKPAAPVWKPVPLNAAPSGEGKQPIATLYQGRDPKMRTTQLTREGGSAETESAVDRALRWLIAHQNADGSWSLDRFGEVPACKGACDCAGQFPATAAATALAILPFLGAGHTHHSGDYQNVVLRALNWLVMHQNAPGDFQSSSYAPMYDQGIATLALCEAYAMTHAEDLRLPASKAVQYIVDAQDPIGGGWRYFPRQTGDLSVTGWQMMALHSARTGGLEVHDDVFRSASMFVGSLRTGLDTRTYTYVLHDNPYNNMTAIGLLCDTYLDPTFGSKALLGCVKPLSQDQPNLDRPDFYYWYYGTLVMHQAGGGAWSAWNDRMREALLASQEKSGHTTGSWSPKRAKPKAHDLMGGRLYATALAACMLEVYYRYMPLYRKP
jgi:hypothetical protein